MARDYDDDARTERDILLSMERTLKAMLALAQQRTARNAPKAIASDRDLDSQYGDPVLKFMPRDWTGESFKGCHFSQCPPELLEMAADTFEYFATQADAKDERTDKGKPTSEYKRADAARARGWAKRLREGKAPVASSSNGGAPGWTDNPQSEWD